MILVKDVATAFTYDENLGEDQFTLMALKIPRKQAIRGFHSHFALHLQLIVRKGGGIGEYDAMVF